jgi:hypothetical protein
MFSKQEERVLDLLMIEVSGLCSTSGYEIGSVRAGEDDLIHVVLMPVDDKGESSSSGATAARERQMWSAEQVEFLMQLPIVRWCGRFWKLTRVDLDDGLIHLTDPDDENAGTLVYFEDLIERLPETIARRSS